MRYDSFRKTVLEIPKIINDAQSRGIVSVLEITNFLIYALLSKNLFLYENHRMALFIGHLYLEQMGVVHKFSVDNITNTSTITDISKLTATW